MADPFSTAAAVLGVADIIMRATNTVFKLISSLRHASAEILHLRRRLSALDQVVMRVKELRSTYLASNMFKMNIDIFRNIDLELELCTADLYELGRLLAEPKGTPNSTLNRFGKAIKTVFAEDQIEKISQRIEKKKSSVSVLLQVLGSRNELEAQNKLNALKNGQETIHQALNRSGDILHDICVKTAIANEQLASFSQLTDSKLNKLDHLDSFMRNLPVLVARENWGESNVIISGSAERAASSLPLVLSFLPKAFKTMNRQSGSTVLSKKDIQWLEHEFAELHLAVMREASKELARRQRFGGRGQDKPPSQSCHKRGKSGNREQLGQAMTEEAANDQSGHRSKNATPSGRVVTARQTKLDLNIFPGRIVFSISESTPDTSFISPNRIIDGVNLLFFPRPELPVSGFAVSASYGWEDNYPISPTLSTFRVIGFKHPIWRLIDSGDIDGVRNFLRRRIVQPCDRDAESGNSLLAWAAWNYQIEICQLLIHEGADVLNCDTDGSSVLSVFLQAMRHNHKPLFSNSTTNYVLQGARTFITACGTSDLSESDRHIAWDGSTTGTFSHGILHRVILEAFPGWMGEKSLKASYEALEILLRANHATDELLNPYLLVNERNGWGRTPLVTATFQVCLPMLPRVLKLLLKYGADPTVIDGDGEGILARLLPTLSCCDIESMGSAWADEMIDIIVTFLKAECDPTLRGSDSGWTPSDNCLTPAAWHIWCSSLTKAGLDPGAVIAQDDEHDSLEWDREELDEMYHDALHGGIVTVDTNSATWPMPNNKRGFNGDDRAEAMTCHLCSSQQSWQPARRPFDLLGSYFKSGFNYHQPLHNHSDGRFCANYVVGDLACGAPEDEHDQSGYPSWPTTEDFSWRKHVAYRLWRNGVVGGSMKDALGWAISDGG